MQTTISENLPFAINVWTENSAPESSATDNGLPRLTYYLPSGEFRTGQSILVCPGGGYQMVSTPKEGHRPAQFLSANGIAAGVLEYRHAPQRHPIPLMDAQRALQIMRQRAGQTEGLSPDAVGCLGFSAGGHLAGTLATHQPLKTNVQSDALGAVRSQPNFLAMIYPVVSLIAPCAHLNSRNNLLGDQCAPELLESLSIELAVDKDTPPCFIAHGQADENVLPENALRLYQSLTRFGVPATMHLYENDGHGFGMGANHPWAHALLEWLSLRL